MEGRAQRREQKEHMMRKTLSQGNLMAHNSQIETKGEEEDLDVTHLALRKEKVEWVGGTRYRVGGNKVPINLSVYVSTNKEKTQRKHPAALFKNTLDSKDLWKSVILRPDAWMDVID
jgi:hypothetical protein